MLFIKIGIVCRMCAQMPFTWHDFPRRGPYALPHPPSYRFGNSSGMRVYPNLTKHLIARDTVMCASFIVGLGAYIMCNWRARVCTLLTGVSHLAVCTLIYQYDHRKLGHELGKIYNHKEMEDWLFRANFYKPEKPNFKKPR